MEDIYFYLPGLADNFEINVMLLERMESHPDHFYDHVKIGAIYGSIPGAIWNGGRYCGGMIDLDQCDYIRQTFAHFGVPVRFTWTNGTLTEDDLQNKTCNAITEMFHDGFNEILVNNDLMENYIRNNYPQYPIISSTTKRITDIDALNTELDKDYKLVVIDYDFNNKWDYLSKIKRPEKCEVLINAVCNPHCPFRKRHYELIGKIQRGLNVHDNQIESCPAQHRRMDEIRKLPTFISNEDIWGKYVPAGFRNFKIEGRECFPMRTIEWYLYYLVKPEYQEEERAWFQIAFETLLTCPNVCIHGRI